MQTKGNLRKRLLGGLGAQGVSQAVQIFIRLAEVPLFLHFWGAQGYGEWLMLAAIPVYLSIADGGFARAASRDMSMRTAAGDQPGALSVYQSIWLLLLGVSLLVGLTTFGLEILPIAQWLDFQFIDSASTKVVLLLLVTHVLVGFQGGLINGGFWCSGRYPLGMLLAAQTALIEFISLAVALFLDGGPIEAASAFLGGRVVGTLLSWIVLRFATPWLHFGWKRASMSEIRRLTAPALASLAFPLGNALNIQGMRIIVGIVLGPPAVAIFTPIRTMTRMAMQPRAIITQLMQPEMAFAYGREDKVLFRRILLRASQLALWGAFVTCLIMALLANLLFSTWTDHQVALDWLLFGLLLITVIIDGAWYTTLMVMYSTNRHLLAGTYFMLVYGGLALILGYAFGSHLGLWGVGLALLFVELAMAVYIIPMALKLTTQSFMGWLSFVINPPTDLFFRRHGLLKQKR